MLKQSSLSLIISLSLAQACASAAPLGGEDETGAGGQTSTSGTPSAAGTGAQTANGTSGASANPAVAGSANGGSGGGAVGVPSAGGSNGGSATSTPMTPFGQVTALLGKRCAGSKCHSSSASQLDLASATGSALHTLLTTPIASGIPHCVGVTLVTPNDTNSPLLKIVMSGGKIACTKPKSENVGPMPDKCTTTSTSVTGVCLTAAEIKTISDWISAGAPQG